MTDSTAADRAHHFQMNPGLPGGQRAQRLTTLIYTDPSPVLPLPRNAESTPFLRQFDTGLDQALAQDDSFLDRAARLLTAVDLTNIEARHASNHGAGPSSAVHQALAARYPAAVALPAVEVVGVGPSPLQRYERTQILAKQATLGAAPARSVQGAQTANAMPSPPMPEVENAENNANDTPVSVPTKRKRSIRRPASSMPVMPHDDNAAASCTSAVVNFLSMDQDADGSIRAQTVARLVRGVLDAIGTAGTTGALQGVEVPLLRQLLEALDPVMRRAEGQLLPAADADSIEAEDAGAIAEAGLDAAAAVLQVAVAAELPRQLVAEEALERVASLVRVQLVQNVYPFHDARLQRLLRPSLATAGTETKGVANKRAKTSKTTLPTVRAPGAVKGVLRRLEAVLALLPGLFAVGGRVPSGSLIPLLQALAQGLTVARLDMLHVQAAGVIVAVYVHVQQHRSLLMEEIVSKVMPYVHMPKAAPRATALDLNACPDMHIVTRILLQMLQGSVQLPAMDAPPRTLHSCFSPAVHAADQFWTLQLERLKHDGRAEGDTDTKLWIERSIADILAVLNCVEWPAATLAVNRLINLMKTARELGLSSPSQAMRQTCVDLLGMVTAALHADKDASDGDASWVAVLLLDGDNGGASAPSEDQLQQGAQTLMLQYLGFESQAGSPTADAATQFVLARSLSEEMSKLQKRGGSLEDCRLILSQLRQKPSQVMQGQITDLSYVDATRVGRYLVQHGPLGKVLIHAGQGPLKWLGDCIRTEQGAVVRSKAVRALRTIVQSSAGVLAQPAVADALSDALQDDAKVVREAAIDLLGRHIGGNDKLALEYFNNFVEATSDDGVSVRKRALQILWDSCIRPPAFPRATVACVAVLRCSTDSEESIRELVAKVFRDLWFPPDGTQQQDEVTKRAKQVAEVAVAWHGSLATIRLPLDPQNPLVTVIAAALKPEKVQKQKLKRGHALAAALLEAVIYAHETSASESAAADAFPPLLVSARTKPS